MAGTGSWRMHKLPSFVVPLFREGPDRIWLLTRLVEVETTSMHTPVFPPLPSLASLVVLPRRVVVDLFPAKFQLLCA
ncbi:hypothetical protein A9K55_001560 [Cordyceps militaris]|uniref:Uncharacterized protein n=1 Tax=Cordyceps militaris TaxID=73501 RepID=A0A2H4SQK6_CORMI|nr:hypothetical protein A9K55_001560 [Cordyceps militaris]